MDHETGDISQFADRRSALRESCRIPRLTVEHPTAGTTTAVVLDLSRDGFRLLLTVSLPCGDEIVIHPPEGSDLRKIRATIVRQSIAVHEGVRMIECGTEVADTAAFRKHAWFLALRIGSEEYEAAKTTKCVEAA